LRISDLGGWLFRRRSWLPLPVVAALLFIPPKAWPSPLVLWSGVLVVALGELLRLWAVQHIGVISRTRSERLGPLVSTGPFRVVRNPLYIGNLGLWVGFTLSAGLLWLLPVIVLFLALEYHAIVRWEETLLDARLGQAYRDYRSQVPRWIPGGAASGVGASRESRAQKRAPADPGFSWRQTFFSERGTLAAIALGYLLLWLKLALLR
jgi:protein-S-isoprenylcysteine O-methyltransferase Ste14